MTESPNMAEKVMIIKIPNCTQSGQWNVKRSKGNLCWPVTIRVARTCVNSHEMQWVSQPFRCWWLIWFRWNDDSWEMTETLAHGYSSESTQRQLSNGYPHDLVKMIFIMFCILVHQTKVTSTSEGFTVILYSKNSPLLMNSVFAKLSKSTKTCHGGCLCILFIASAIIYSWNPDTQASFLQALSVHTTSAASQ